MSEKIAHPPSLSLEIFSNLKEREFWVTTQVQKTLDYSVFKKLLR